MKKASCPLFGLFLFHNLGPNIRGSINLGTRVSARGQLCAHRNWLVKTLTSIGKQQAVSILLLWRHVGAAVVHRECSAFAVALRVHADLWKSELG